jgi:hypothetical protein
MSSLYFFYKLVRMLTRREVIQALDNAHDVINIERQLGLFTEASLQALVLHNHSVVRFFDTYYVSAHFVLITMTLIALYVSRPEGYFHSRRILLAMTSIALLIHVTYPLAPPRMFPVLGFVDTGQVVGPGAYGHGGTFSGVANQFAAMPSMHFGWALLVAWAVIVYAPSRYRYLIVLHPVLTLLAIVVTANHYWVDAAVAALIFVMVLWTEQRLARPSSNPELASGPIAPERRIPGLAAKAGEA